MPEEVFAAMDEFGYSEKDEEKQYKPTIFLKMVGYYFVITKTDFIMKKYD